MRLATSAMAAASGLLLLGLAFYGQPAVYLHQAREQWDALMDHPQTEQTADSESDTGPERAAQLQREVALLEAELAARRALDNRPQSVSPPDAPLPDPSAALSAPAQAVPGVAASEPADGHSTGSPDAAQFALQPPVSSNPISAPMLAWSKPVVLTSPPAPTSAVPARPTSAASAAAPFTSPAQLDQQATEDRPAPSAPRVTPPPPSLPSPALQSPAMVPEHHETVGSSPPSRVDLSKNEAAKPAPPPKQAPQRPTLAAPALPQPAPSRQDADDSHAVLVRLRQVAPGNPPIQQADVPIQASPKPRPSPSPLLPKLGSARAALANGQIEDGRRLLQEAQLQLVFRPLDTVDDASPSASRGAADVAHALEALSASDVPLSRRYIDVALDDLSGNPTRPPIQESSRRPSGYAPAYPPR